MGEGGNESSRVETFQNLNEQSYHKGMETASLPIKQPDLLASMFSSDSKKVNGHELKPNVSAGKTKVKKKMRVEDIITNLKKVKQVASVPPKEHDTSPKENNTSPKEDHTSPKENNTSPKEDHTSPKENDTSPKESDTSPKEDHTSPKENDVSTKEHDTSPIGDLQEEDASSFASMCTIRKDLDYPDLTDLPPLTKQNVEQSNTVQVKRPSSLPGNIVQPAKIIQTIPSPANSPKPVRQLILQTVPQTNSPNQQTPIILNKLPPGFIIRNDLPPGSFPNLQNTSTSGQPKILLITKAGGPFFLAQNINAASTKQTQAKLGNKPNSSPVFSQAKHVVVSNNLSGTQKVNFNKNIVGFSASPSKTNAETPLKFVQYNLPYPNNNCKVVNNPNNVRTVLSSPPGTRPTLVNVPKPREMVVNFAGNQTAHITTMSDEPAAVPERQTQFIPSFLYGSPPDTSTIQNKKPSPVGEKRTVQARIFRNTKVSIQMPQRRSTYDEKIAKLTGKMTDIRQPMDVNNKAKTLSNGLKRKSNVSDVRVSNRKRQKTEKAKLFEKAKKRKKNEKKRKKKNKDKMKLDIKVKVEKPDSCDVTSPKTIDPAITINKPLPKESETVPQQTVVENETDSKKQDDPESLFRDPALLTREERALQRALMMFKELEEKQARKETVSEADTASRKSAKANQLNSPTDVLRKRKVSNEGNGESFLKKRKRKMEKHSIETNTTSTKDAEERPKKSEIVDKMIKEKLHCTIENIPVRKVVPEKAEITSGTVKGRPHSTKEITKETTKETKHLKPVKDNTAKPLKPSPKTPDLIAEKHRVKTYMLVPSYHGFQDFSPVVLGSRTRSKKTEPAESEKEDEVPAMKSPVKSEQDIPLLVIETVGNKAVKQDVVAKDEHLRDFVKNSLRAQGMLKQELELTEKDKDADHFENREKRHLQVNRNTGETVLHKASRMGYDETVYHCIQQGSDSNAKDNAGWTPLHEACSRGHADVVRVLVKYNADVHACSNDGIRPIHDAADNGNPDSLRLLMAYCADPFISTYSGRSVVDCAKRPETKDYIKACIGDLYLNDERNNIVSLDHENRWDFRGSSSILDKDRKYLGDIFDNLPKQQPSNSVEFEWSETPHLPTYSLPLVKDGIVVGRKNYILLDDLQETLNKPRQNVIRLLKRTKIRTVSWTEFTKEVSRSYFNKLRDPLSSPEEGNVELVPLNWTVRSLLKIKCEHLAL